MPVNKNNIFESKKKCLFCTTNIGKIDYKDVQTLRRFISSYAKILPRRKTGVCAKHQRKLAKAIKRARTMSLLPFVTK